MSFETSFLQSWRLAHHFRRKKSNISSFSQKSPTKAFNKKNHERNDIFAQIFNNFIYQNWFFQNISSSFWWKKIKICSASVIKKTIYSLRWLKNSSTCLFVWSSFVSLRLITRWDLLATISDVCLLVWKKAIDKIPKIKKNPIIITVCTVHCFFPEILEQRP